MTFRALKPVVALWLQAEANNPLESELHKLIAHAGHRFGMSAIVAISWRGKIVWVQNHDGLMIERCGLRTTLSTIATRENQLWMIQDVEHARSSCGEALLTLDPAIRFIAGCSALSTPGSSSASLCLFDVVPRHLDSADLAVFQKLTNDVACRVSAWEQTARDAIPGLWNSAGFVPLAQTLLQASSARGLNATLIRICAGTALSNSSDTLSEPDIAAFADVLRATFRETDSFGRLTAYEFVALMIDCDYAEAIKAVARFRANLQVFNRERPGAKLLVATYSIVKHDPQRHRGIVDLLQDGAPGA
ncbi:MAG: hypothetical protein RLZZ227_2425 [Pseudomonadota bacterium]|jgi:hypothetical protein